MRVSVCECVPVCSYVHIVCICVCAWVVSVTESRFAGASVCTSCAAGSYCGSTGTRTLRLILADAGMWRLFDVNSGRLNSPAQWLGFGWAKPCRAHLECWMPSILDIAFSLDAGATVCTACAAGYFYGATGVFACKACVISQTSFPCRNGLSL